MGCFADLSTQRQLTELTQSMATSLNAGTLVASYFVSSSLMTISYCISVCQSFNFEFAGINYG